MVMRALFIIAGTALIHRFEWIIYAFGILLIYSGIHLAITHNKEIHPENNPILYLLRRAIPITDGYEGNRFFIRRNGKLWGTPLLVTLVVIEASDVMFAVDSIPAVLAITANSFIAYSSNICAILGLRSLFFALAGLMGMFRYLDKGLVAILIFVGTKMVLHDILPMPTWLSLGVVALLLTAAIGASWAFPDPQANNEKI